MPTSLAEQVCVCWLKHSELRWPPSKDVFALVECAMAMTLPAGHSMDSNLQPVDFARYYSVLIRKPLSCVIDHDIARSVLDCNGLVNRCLRVGRNAGST